MDRPFSVGSYVVLIMAAITEVTQEDYKFLASLNYKAKPRLQLVVEVYTCSPALKEIEAGRPGGKIQS